MKLIINADDFGISKCVNHEIERYIKLGLVQSATMLANGPMIDEAIAISKKYRHVSFGVHLNLTEFNAISKNKDLRGLTNEKNCFFTDPRQLKISPLMKKAIYQEWSMQIEKLLSFGIDITHMDSHHHVHTDPQLFRIIKSLKNKYKIPRVRVTRNLYKAPISRLLFLKKKIWRSALINYAGCRVTDFFTDLEVLHFNYDKLNNKNITIEIEVHPGLNNSITLSGPDKVMDSEWFRKTSFNFISFYDI